ncbi:MAG TPA: glycine cleavage system protein GcvH [Steroidobacteraceae bacterium]|nr:glycine cleavage system protein GcvH [Steroidobacteraceae bacterium]
MSNNIPADLKYTKSHEWVRRAHGEAPDGALEVGITDHAQSALGDLVFVEVPDVGRILSAGEACAVVESVKAASDVYSPIAGKVIAHNTALAGKPELLNEDPYGAGWLFRLDAGTSANAASLMSASAYESFLAEESE